ncbi:hypothetical protein ACFT2C_06170 [Promicromonospora sp. NPDC057138]|uniref:hypothetical protein n=1 Tax=Promicromonospora sp. NPDC057138 TaxID=3346031 RepID=UPI00362BD9EB
MVRRRSRSSAIFARAALEWSEMRAEYELYLESHIEAAADACRDALLSARGRGAGITVRELFVSGPQFANAYASEELLTFWQHTPRLTVADFEEQWLTRDSASDPGAWSDVA